MMEIYGRAAESNQVLNTLRAMRDNGMSRETYNRFVQEAREQGLIGNPLTAAEILRPLEPGEARYGWGP
jgi:hypothetical protein